MATSARRSRPSASRAWSGKTATPALASRTRVRPSRSSGEESSATRWRATRWALVVESAVGSRTANSSPPSRAASAPRGRARRSRSAIWRRSRSPARWPRVSLTERKRSRSMRTRAARVPWPSASSRAVQARSRSHWRLGRPVSGSRSCSSARARAIQRVESRAMRGTAKSGRRTGRLAATAQMSGVMPRRATATRPCRRRAVRATVGSPRPWGASVYHRRSRVTTR